MRPPYSLLFTLPSVLRFVLRHTHHPVASSSCVPCHRRRLKHPEAASAAPRVWRCTLHRLLHTAARVSSLQFAEWLLSQSLQEGLSVVALRLLLLSPSPQRLPQYIADVVHIVSTVYMLCQQYTLPGQARCVGAGFDTAGVHLVLGLRGKGPGLPVMPCSRVCSSRARNMAPAHVQLHDIIG